MPDVRIRARKMTHVAFKKEKRIRVWGEGGGEGGLVTRGVPHTLMRNRDE